MKTHTTPPSEVTELEAAKSWLLSKAYMHDELLEKYKNEVDVDFILSNEVILHIFRNEVIIPFIKSRQDYVPNNVAWKLAFEAYYNEVLHPQVSETADKGEGSKRFTVSDMCAAMTYGFEYHRDSQNDDVDVPKGNKLQWLVWKYGIDPEDSLKEFEQPVSSNTGKSAEKIENENRMIAWYLERGEKHLHNGRLSVYVDEAVIHVKSLIIQQTSEPQSKHNRLVEGVKQTASLEAEKRELIEGIEGVKAYINVLSFDAIIAKGFKDGILKRLDELINRI